MSTPDLLYSEAEDDLRAAVRSLLTDRCPPATVLSEAESGRAHDVALWGALGAEMGTAGLLVPDKLGGQGATCLLYTSPSPRDPKTSRMPSSA